MSHERTRFLIQHRQTKAYIQSTTDVKGHLTATEDPWKAWGIDNEINALHILEENPFMPPDKENYRIVKVRDSREVPEDGA